jgi:uncharacterized 2Fe-2S/4Fe-4S cluster protein (DUF4445 family)
VKQQADKKQKCKVSILPFNQNIDIASGSTILQAIKKADLPLSAACGGEGTCGECIVWVKDGKYSSKSSSVISERLRSQGYVLACQTKITEDITIRLPLFQELTFQRSEEIPYLEKQNISGFFEVAPPVKLRMKTYGLACDIGTSTVALYLVNLKDGKILSTATSLNQQIKCGEDVISRINYAKKPGHLDELHDLIIRTIDLLVDTASQASEVLPADIYYASLSGNTTMIHLLLNLDPSLIREQSRIPAVSRLPLLKAQEVGLNMNQKGLIHIAPSPGSYVGGDITAGLLCTPMLKSSEHISMFIDAGTNGELVIGNKEWLISCACSAGPAFEGMGIKCGIPAVEGAIEKVQIDQDGTINYSTIGGGKPKGLCGSGLVDLMSELFIQGYINKQGKYCDDRSCRRIVTTDEGIGFLIEEGKKCFWGQDLILTERDVSHLIRTKGAVYAACSVLLKHVGLSFDEIEAFYVAGGFGSNLNIENAVRIGLLPDIDQNRFHYIGNSSLRGAYLILLSDRNKDMVNEISEKMTYIELNTEPLYMNEFTGALFLPHTDINLFPSVQKKLSRNNS